MDKFNYLSTTYKGFFSKSESILIVFGVEIFLVTAVYSTVYVSVIVVKSLDSYTMESCTVE